MDRERSTGDGFRSVLPLLLLRQLVAAPAHGYALMEGLRAAGFDVKGATVYPHLNRLQEDGFIQPEWQAPESGPARKVMSITEDGRARLGELQEQWVAFRDQVDMSLGDEQGEERR